MVTVNGVHNPFRNVCCMVTDSFIIFCNHQIVQRLDICGNSLSHTLQNFILDLIKKIIHDIIGIDNLPCKLQILLNVCIDAFCTIEAVAFAISFRRMLASGTPRLVTFTISAISAAWSPIRSISVIIFNAADT